LHLQLYRDAGPERRVEIAAELSDFLRELSRAGVRRRHPEFSADQVDSEVLRIFFGVPSRDAK
jgi:hypothetical protein